MIRKKGGCGMGLLDTKAYLDQVCAMLREGAESVPVPVAGTSMCPFLRHGDTVYLDLPRRALKKGDIVLFTRPDGRYILHRIAKACPPDGFLLLGDNQISPEAVPEARICAIVTSARCGGKLVFPDSARWRFYAGPWLVLTPHRTKIAALRGKLRR